MSENEPPQRPRITQEMIALFDDYTHLSLDRRKFMDSLAKMVGSMSAAATAAALMASNAQAQGLSDEADQRLLIEDVTYPGDGGDMRGYLARPVEGGPFGAVIVIHENRGLNPHIKDVTRRIALEGFLALAPDYLSDQGGTPEDEDAARELFGNLDAGAVAADGVATIAWLRMREDCNGKVGAMGFCWGGGTVNNLAVASPDLAAGVAYYGGQPPADQVAGIKARLMLHYAGLDDRINAGIPDFQAALDDAGIDYQLFMYDGVNHAFNNDTSDARYDAAAAELAWQRTVDFFREALA